MSQPSLPLPRVKNINTDVNVLYLYQEKFLIIQRGSNFGIFEMYFVEITKTSPSSKDTLFFSNVFNNVSKTSNFVSILSAKSGKKTKGMKVKSAELQDMQLSFFQLNDPVLENIREQLVSIDINTLTPVEALMKLNEIKKLIGG